MKLSICIPAFNNEEHIGDAIDSVLQQSFSDFELIIVDDNSTDKTVEQVKKYNDPRIKLFRNTKNLGLVGNWNYTVQQSKGDYIKLLPADDFLYPGSLQQQVEILDNDEDMRIALVCGRRNIVNESGKVLFKRGFSSKQIEINGIKAIHKTIVSGGNIIGEPGSIMFRKAILSKTGLFNDDNIYVVDLDMYFRLLRLGNLYSMPDIVSAFRVSVSSTSVKIMDQQYEMRVRFIKKLTTDKRYQISRVTYSHGVLKSYFLILAKKILYYYLNRKH